MDQLSNGDIFLHDVVIVSNHFQERPATPGYEPTVHSPRKAFKPEVKPRVGIMCPTCHQSRILLYAIDKGNHDDDMFSMCFVFSYDETQLFMLSTRQVFEGASLDLILDKVNRGPNREWTPNANDVLALRGFLKTQDFIIHGLGDASTLSLASIAEEWKADKDAKCPYCGKVHTIQEWINEFANPTAGFHDICRICGGEQSIAVGDGFKGDLMKQPMKCEVCGYESKRDLSV